MYNNDDDDDDMMVIMVKVTKIPDRHTHYCASSYLEIHWYINKRRGHDY